MPARLVQWAVAVGDVVAAGADLAVLESMKMEHVLLAPHAGRVQSLAAAPGAYLVQAQPLLVLEPVQDAAVMAQAQAQENDRTTSAPTCSVSSTATPSPSTPIARCGDQAPRAGPAHRARKHCRPVRCRQLHRIRRAGRGRAGPPPQHGRPHRQHPGRRHGDGHRLVNGAQCGEERARTVVMAYDATVLAGTQGARNHAKTDRMLGVALDQQLPVVLFAEGGGGRPAIPTSPWWRACMCILLPATRRCRARCPWWASRPGAALLATPRCWAAATSSSPRKSNIGMGGPAMIEGGGLGVFKPEQIGPSHVQHANGVIDVLVEDEQGSRGCRAPLPVVLPGSPGRLERARPARPAQRGAENRLRVYDTPCHGGPGGRRQPAGAAHRFWHRHPRRWRASKADPVGLIANNPLHLGGAIDADAADKAARFMQLCNAHGLPLVSLIDTPGFMVGPEVEQTAQVRHVSRMFVTAAHLRVPFFSVVLRKGYGLGAMGMAAGGLHAPVFTVAWPTGSLAPWGWRARCVWVSGRTRSPARGPEREALYQNWSPSRMPMAKPCMAATLEIDAVIDPLDPRAWLARGWHRHVGARACALSTPGNPCARPVARPWRGQGRAPVHAVAVLS